MTSRDTRYLKQRVDGLWLVQLAVPRGLRATLGMEVVQKSLRTKDYAKAIKRRDEIVANIRDNFKRTVEGRRTKPDYAFIDLWQSLADAGFYRPADGFRYLGQRFYFKRSDGLLTTWSSKCGDCQKPFTFEAPGRFPPRDPERLCNSHRKKSAKANKRSKK